MQTLRLGQERDVEPGSFLELRSKSVVDRLAEQQEADHVRSVHRDCDQLKEHAVHFRDGGTRLFSFERLLEWRECGQGLPHVRRPG